MAEVYMMPKVWYACRLLRLEGRKRKKCLPQAQNRDTAKAIIENPRAECSPHCPGCCPLKLSVKYKMYCLSIVRFCYTY